MGHRSRAGRFLVAGPYGGAYRVADVHTGHLLPQEYSTVGLARAEAERLNQLWRQERLLELLEFLYGEA